MHVPFSYHELCQIFTVCQFHFMDINKKHVCIAIYTSLSLFVFTIFGFATQCHLSHFVSMLRLLMMYSKTNLLKNLSN